MRFHRQTWGIFPTHLPLDVHIENVNEVHRQTWGMFPTHLPLDVHIENVNEVHLDVPQPVLVDAAPEAHGGPPRPGGAHLGLAAVSVPRPHLWTHTQTPWLQSE